MKKYNKENAMRKLLFLFFTFLPMVAMAQNEDILSLKPIAPNMYNKNGRYSFGHVKRKAANSSKKNQAEIKARRISSKEPYAVFEDGVLTFYCDGERSARSGGTYDIPNEADENSLTTPAWLKLEDLVVKVVFAPSFASARPITLGDWFREFTSLKEIEGMEYLNTSQVLHMCLMFYNCSSLKNLDLSHFDTSIVLDMDGMFGGCSALTSLDVSHFDTGNVTDMSWMFGGCSALTSLDVSHFDTGNVTDMSWMFGGCSALTSLDVSHFDTGNVTDMYSMFYDCSALTFLDVSHFDTGNVTDMSWMFGGCSALTSLDVSHFDTGNVTDMYSMFYDCSALTSLDVSHFDTGNVTDMSWMFANCKVLKLLDVSHFDTGNVKEMHSIFDNCEALTSLDVSHFDTGNVTDMNSMFCACRALTLLDVSHFDTGNVTDMSWMFVDCSALTSIDVSHFDTGNVKEMRLMFYGCSALISLDLSHFDTKNVENMYRMFFDCSKLETIYANIWSTASLVNGDDMFYGCTSLVGGNGTRYDNGHIDYIYARIDGGADCPGYFTYKEPTKEAPLINLIIKDWDGIMTALFNSIPNDLRYRLNEKSSSGAVRKVYEIKHSHYPNTIMVSDYPPADGTYTYYVSAVYLDENGKEKGTKSNEITITFNNNATEEKPQFGSIVGRVVFSNTSGLELPSVDVDVEFSDDGSKVRVEPNGTFHRDGIPLGKTITLKIADDNCYTYKPVTVVVSKDTQNEVQVIEATAREGVDVSVKSNNYDLRIDNFVNAAPEYFEMDVVNTKNQPWTGVVNLIAYKKDDAKKVEQLNNSGVSFSTAKPYYIVGSARVEKLSTGASKHLKIAITDFPTLKKDEYYKFYFVSKRNEDSSSMSYKSMSFSDKNLRNPMDVYMIVQEPKYRSEKFPEIPDEVDAYMMDVFDIMKTLDKIDGPMGEACQKLAELMEKYERDKNLEGFYGNLPELLKSFKIDLENAVKDVKDFTDIFEKGRKYFNQIKDAYNIIYNKKTKKDEVSLYVKICKKVFELSGDPLSKIYCMYMDILEKSAEKILKLQEELVDAQIDDIFNNNQITFKLRVAHKKKWNEYITGTRYYSPYEINNRIKDIEIHMVTAKPQFTPQNTQFQYSLDPSIGIESWASYYVDKNFDGDAVVLKRDGSRSSINNNIDYTMVRFWMKIRWKNGRVSTVPLYRDCSDWHIDGQGVKSVITTTLESTTYNMDDKIYLKY